MNTNYNAALNENNLIICESTKMWLVGEYDAICRECIIRLTHLGTRHKENFLEILGSFRFLAQNVTVYSYVMWCIVSDAFRTIAPPPQLPLPLSYHPWSLA